MIDYVIGAGQGGCRIAKTFGEEFETQTCFMNLARVDFSQLNVARNSALLIDAGGTGRNPKVGEAIARENAERIERFLIDQTPDLTKGSKVVLCVGGGGGSGAGLMPMTLDYLLARKADVLLVYTLPERTEGLPAKPNALHSLNNVISRYLETDKITALVVDNSFCVDRFGAVGQGEEGDYWSKVNGGIVRSLLRFWYLTNLEQFTNFVDVTSGYGALDERELLRVMYAKGGFLDLREFTCDEPSLEQAAEAKFRSLVFGNLDIGSTKEYIVAVGFPWEMRGDKRVQPFLEEIFKKISKVTKTSFVLRSSHFNKKLTDIRVNVLLSGLVKSHGLKKIINQTVKDVTKYRAKGGIEKLDLSEIDFK